jgi:hypothetical protein
MAEYPLTLTLHLTAGADADPEELDEVTRRLGTELLNLDVYAVEPVRAGDAPPGTRAADVLALGSVLVTLARSGDTLKMLVGVVQAWLHTQPARAVEMQIGGDTLKLSGVSSAEQARLINLFVERHSVEAPRG